jgi:hypothetical protein
MESAGLPQTECTVIFPEIITQDRSQKLKDLALCEAQRWFAPNYTASAAAKEMGRQNFAYEQEIELMKQELPEIPMPLTAPPQQDTSFGGASSDIADPTKTGVSGLTSEDKKTVKFHDTHF